MKNDHISIEKFWLEWFGNFGRILGSQQIKPNRWFTDNPNDLLAWLKTCEEAKASCWISVHPFKNYDWVLGFEKLFFDFDYGKKSENLNEKQIMKLIPKLEMEVRQFIYKITKHGIIPLIVKTRKGYHVYIFFDSIYEINHTQETEKFWKRVYGNLQRKFWSKAKYRFCDSSVIGDIRRFARVPISVHEKNGEKCIIVDNNLKPTKLRSLDFYRTYGMKKSDIYLEALIVSKKLKKEAEEQIKRRAEHKEEWKMKHGFVGEVRPCFTERVNLGEMCHLQRLAFVIELYYSGYKTVEAQLPFFEKFKDFKEKVSREQIGWQLEHICTKPYQCSTIMEKGWCLKDKCPIWRKRHGKKNS